MLWIKLAGVKITKRKLSTSQRARFFVLLKMAKINYKIFLACCCSIFCVANDEHQFSNSVSDRQIELTISKSESFHRHCCLFAHNKIESSSHKFTIFIVNACIVCLWCDSISNESIITCKMTIELQKFDLMILQIITLLYFYSSRLPQ